MQSNVNAAKWHGIRQSKNLSSKEWGGDQTPKKPVTLMNMHTL